MKQQQHARSMERIDYAVDERDGVFFRRKVAAAVAKKSLEQRPVARVNGDVAALYNQIRIIYTQS